MTRLWFGTLALALAGCTADFFVGPMESGQNTSESPDDSGLPPGTSGGPSTTADGTSTTQGPTTTDPEFSTSSTTDETTTAAETSGGTELSAGSTTGEPTGETQEPEDCVAKEAPACEEAFPSCLWNGEACTLNPCNVGLEEDCLGEAPSCVWEGGGCVPSECGEEAECSPLEPGPCEEAKGCQVIGEMCFSAACVPCGEVEDSIVCNELPNCAYNEGREACLPQ